MRPLFELVSYKMGKIKKPVLVCGNCRCIIKRRFNYCPSCGDRIEWVRENVIKIVEEKT